MSFTLATLKTAIQDYTDNSETVFVSQLNNFIKAAEEKILKSVDLDYFRKNVTSALTSSDQFLTVPNDYLASFCNKKLSMFEGAATWILNEENSGKIPILQLKESFFKKKRYLKIYKLEEILTHEFVHFARCNFEENVFEEFFAYLTSASIFRRILGPITSFSFLFWGFFFGFILGSFLSIFHSSGFIFLTSKHSHIINFI